MSTRRIILGLVAIACLAPSQTVADTYTMDGSLKGDIEMNVALTPEDGAEKVSVVINCRVRHGEVEWQLTDPGGETVFSGHSVKGKLFLESGELEARSGIWRLKMKGSDVKMSYEIETLGMEEVEEES